MDGRCFKAGVKPLATGALTTIADRFVGADDEGERWAIL
jgi:hypothetical protein